MGADTSVEISARPIPQEPMVCFHAPLQKRGRSHDELLATLVHNCESWHVNQFWCRRPRAPDIPKPHASGLHPGVPAP